jgi:hypothetical protein
MEKKVALITLVILVISMGLYYFTQSNVLGVVCFFVILIVSIINSIFLTDFLIKKLKHIKLYEVVSTDASLAFINIVIAFVSVQILI